MQFLTKVVATYRTLPAEDSPLREKYAELERRRLHSDSLREKDELWFQMQRVMREIKKEELAKERRKDAAYKTKLEIRQEEAARKSLGRYSNKSSIVLYHGTLQRNLKSILKNGIKPSSGWGGANTHGVFLSKSRAGAKSWAKIAYQRTKPGAYLEEEHFDKNHGDKENELIAVVKVVIPKMHYNSLRADMEQAEDYHFKGGDKHWEMSLDVIGDVRFEGKIPASWVKALVTD